MHWTVRNKKEPMLEASKVETPVNAQEESLHCEQEAPGVSSYESAPSSSEYISKVSALEFRNCTKHTGKFEKQYNDSLNGLKIPNLLRYTLLML